MRRPSLCRCPCSVPDLLHLRHITIIPCHTQAYQSQCHPWFHSRNSSRNHRRNSNSRNVLRSLLRKIRPDLKPKRQERPRPRLQTPQVGSLMGLSFITRVQTRMQHNRGVGRIPRSAAKLRRSPVRVVSPPSVAQSSRRRRADAPLLIAQLIPHPHVPSHKGKEKASSSNGKLALTCYRSQSLISPQLPHTAP